MMHLNWTFKAEGFVGCTSKLAHSMSFGLPSTALSGKLLGKYLVLLHVQITMLGFGWKDEDEERLQPTGLDNRCAALDERLGNK